MTTNAGGASASPSTAVITASGTYTIPSDWNNADYKIEALGAGGTGGTSVSNTNGGVGGGGGEYAQLNSHSFTPGDVLTINIPAGGADSTATGTTVTVGGVTLLLANNGQNGGSNTAGGAGGTGGTGDILYDGGAGGAAGVNNIAAAGAGGGGSAGSNGIGKAGNAGPATTGRGGGGGVAQMVGCRRPAVVRRIAMVVMVVMPVMERLVGSEEPAIPIMLSRVSMVQVAVAVGMVAPPMLCPVLLAGQSLFGVLTSAHLVVAVVAAQLVAPEQQATIVVVQVVAMAAAVAVVVFRGRTPMSVELAARAFWS